MRSVWFSVVAPSALVLPLAASLACKKTGGAADAASDAASASASASASAADTTTASASASGTSVTHWSPTHGDAGADAGPSKIALGAACTPEDGYSGFACAPDGVTELTCSGGTWAVQQACKGPGACKQDGSG